MRVAVQAKRSGLAEMRAPGRQGRIRVPSEKAAGPKGKEGGKDSNLVTPLASIALHTSNG